jgi:hypothetical protein
VIDQQGREVPQDALREQRNGPFGRVGFGHSTANPFDRLTRQQRLKRLEAVARLLDIAFILPGTRIRYGVDGIIGLIPIVFRANMRNARLLRRWLDHEPR